MRLWCAYEGCSVFTSQSRARHSLISVREMCEKTNVQESCKVADGSWNLYSFLPFPAIRASLVVLAVHVALAILEVPSKLPKMKMMPAIHKMFHNSHLATQVLIAAFHRVVFPVSPVLPGVREQQVIGLQV